MSQAPQNESQYRVPRYPRANGRVREDHAAASVLFLQCESDTCKPEGDKPEGEIREFQIKSFDAGSGLSVFRCVICGSLLELKKNQIDKLRASGE